MATAQAELARRLAQELAALKRPNVFSVSIYAPGIIEVVGKTATPFKVYTVGPPGSVMAAGIYPYITEKASNPYTVYIILPSTTAPGDKVKVHLDGQDWTFTLDKNFVADAGGIKYPGDNISSVIPGAPNVPGAGDIGGGETTPPDGGGETTPPDGGDGGETTPPDGGGGGPTPPPVGGVISGETVPDGTEGSTIIPATRALAPGQRALVVYESNPTIGGGGRMFALHPNQASGVALPAFKTVTANPAAGRVLGEAIINTTTGLSYVWDGLNWKSIVPPSIVTYPSDAAVLADNTAQAGTYAFSTLSGNLFVRYNNGTADKWRQIGTRTYATEAALLLDTPGDGSIAYATDTKTIWYRVGNAWRSNSFMIDTDANIKAQPATAGLIAVATDTTKMYLGNGTRWVGQFVTEYATQVEMIADAPLDGTLGVAIDTGRVGFFHSGVWTYINSSAVPPGDVWQVGSVQQSMLSEAEFASLLTGPEATKWVLADGRAVAGSRYATLTGKANVPDLRGAYLRMAGQNGTNAAWNGGALGDWQEDRTKAPTTPLTGTTNSAGAHTHNMTIPFRRADVNASWQGAGEMLVRYSATSVGNAYNQPQDTGSAGAHTHTVSVTSGGDSETRPKSYVVNYFIKIN